VIPTHTGNSRLLKSVQCTKPERERRVAHSFFSSPRPRQVKLPRPSQARLHPPLRDTLSSSCDDSPSPCALHARARSSLAVADARGRTKSQPELPQAHPLSLVCQLLCVLTAHACNAEQCVDVLKKRSLSSLWSLVRFQPSTINVM